jgi:hypothetical protein
MTSPIFVFVTLFIGIPLLLCTIFYFKFGRELLKARASAAPVKFIELIALKLRKIPSDVIIDARIKAANNGINVSIDDLATHFLAGGNVNMVVDGLVSAKEKNLNLSFGQASTLDLDDKNISAEIHCRECGAAVSDKLADCTSCWAKWPGATTKTYKSVQKIKLQLGTGLILIVVLIIFQLVSNAGPSNEKLLNAAESGDIETVREQLIKGANLEAICEGCGGTPLIHAAKIGSDEIIRYLISEEAHIHSTDKKGNMPIHVATIKGHIHAIELLSKNGANINARSFEMKLTCLHIAVAHFVQLQVEHPRLADFGEIIMFLLNNNAEMNALTKQGFTPLDFALVSDQKGKGKIDIVEILRKHGGKTGEELKAEGK